MLNPETDGYRRLLWETEHPPVYHQGVSEAALRTMRELVGELETLDPAAFEPAPAGNAEARRAVRYLAALVPDHIEDRYIPTFVADIIANPRLSATMVAEVMEGDARRHHNTGSGGRGWTTDGPTLRRAGQLLRAGSSQREVADQLGIARDTVTRLATFLGVAQAREEFLRDVAADHLEEGGTVEEFAHTHSMPVGRARTLLGQVAQALGMGDTRALA